MRIVKYLREYLLKYINKVIIFIVSSLIVWGISVLMPYIVGKYIDSLSAYAANEKILYYTKLLGLTIILQIIVYYIKNLISSILNSKIAFDLNFDLIERVERFPLKILQSQDTTYLNQRISMDCNNVVSFFLNNLIDLLTNTLTIIMIVYVIIRINIRVGILLSATIPLYILAYVFLKKPLYDIGYKVKEKQNTYFAKINEQFNKIKMIKINTCFEESSQKITDSFNSLFISILKYYKVSYAYSSIDLIIRNIAVIILFFFGGFEVIGKRMSIGNFVLINNYFSMLLNSTSYLMNFGKSYQDALVSFNRIIDIQNTNAENNGKIEIENINNIQLNKVNFFYDPNKIVLNDINYTFSKGNIYSVEGRNGIGKSTLIDIILGILQDFSGEVMFDSVNIRKLDMYKVRRKLISVVEQSPTLFNDSIYNNICYGCNAVSLDKISKLCDIVGLQNFILGLPDEINYQIEENSCNISGGERQKIAVLRALAKESQVIVLDEPTSAMDVKSVERLKKVFLEIKKNKIIIIVTHSKQLSEITDYTLKLDGDVNTA